MVFLLAGDVLDDGFFMVGADGEYAVSGLPMKLGEVRGFLVNPLGGAGFDFFYQIRHGDGAG